EDPDNVVVRIGNQHSFVFGKELGKAVPAIADDRRSTGARFEQPHAWRPAAADHVGPRQIKRVSLAAVKGSMGCRRHVLQTLDIVRPIYVVWILRPGNDKAAIR